MKLTHKLNTSYVTKKNHEHAVKKARAFGSKSAYINHLISKDRGLKKIELGYWKPKTK